VGLFIVRIVELLIVLVPLIGLIYGGYKAVSKVRERSEVEAEPPQLDATEPQRTSKSAQWQAIMRVVREHDRTDTRWLDYELDVSKLLDYPLMTDMRDSLTQRFHRAKLRADMLRPADAGDLLDDSEAARQYLDAVEEYVTAFDVAETEAIRRRRSGFSRGEQQRLSRAHGAMRIATDSAAPQERERAFDVARRELEGLVVLPERTRAAIERGIAGELDG
jgi:hypothetical protein